MRMITRLAAGVVACLFAVPASAASDSAAIEARAKEILPWVAKQTGYRMDYVKPVILIADQEAINVIYYGPLYRKGGLMKVIAATAGQTILLPDWFALGKNDETLAHELAHVLQNANDAQFQCVAVMEHEAYSVADRFVDEFGVGEKTNPIFLMMISRCPNRYGLP